jgi:glycosyltransferase involved in cell wall biosynthesis
MSESESFGMVILEAWKFGRPVIVNKHCAAFSDLVENEVDGLLVDINDLEKSVRSLVLNPKFADEMGKNGQIKSHKYNWSKVKSDFNEIVASRAKE